MPLSIPHLPVPLNDYQGYCYLRPPEWGWLLTAPENQDLGGKGVLLKSGAEGEQIGPRSDLSQHERNMGEQLSM